MFSCRPDSSFSSLWFALRQNCWRNCHLRSGRKSSLDERTSRSRHSLPLLVPQRRGFPDSSRLPLRLTLSFPRCLCPDHIHRDGYATSHLPRQWFRNEVRLGPPGSTSLLSFLWCLSNMIAWSARKSPDLLHGPK